MANMKSMELDDESKMDLAPSYSSMISSPDYPYGLRIELTDREMDKLDLDPSVAEFGDVVHMRAVARIVSVSRHKSEDGEKCSVSLQIESMAVDGDEEN